MRWVLPAIIAVTGCVEFHLDPVEDGTTPQRALVEEVFAQAPLPAVDLLLVVDDTASMSQEQAVLTERVLDLLVELDETGIEWHLGVVSTDMMVERAGWLQGTPWVVTPSTGDRDAAVTQALAVGTDGALPEAGLAAAERALALAAPGEANAGFRRSGAALHVVFVSDADDSSDDWLGDDPVQVFLDRLDAEPGLALASAVVGDEKVACTSPMGSARPAPRYREVARASGGTSVSICDPDLAPLALELAQLSTVYEVRFPLREVPLDGTVRVEVDGERLHEGWSVDDEPAVVFDVPPPPRAELRVRYQVEVAP